MDTKCMMLNWFIAISLFVIVVQGDGMTTSAPLPEKEKCLMLSNSSCETCLGQSWCFWCSSSNTADRCQYYPYKNILPPSSLCPIGDIKFGTCFVNYEILLIVCGILAAILLIAISTCVIYCCCCRRKRGMSRREVREDQAQSAEYDERRARNAERRAERQARWDGIRQKYGLGSSNNTAAGGSSSYSRFDNAEA